MQKVPELLVSQIATKEKEPKKEKKKSEVVSLVHRKMEEKASTYEFKHTEEKVQWRNINQEEIDSVWMRLSENDEVLEKYTLKVSKRGAFSRRGDPSVWRMVQRVQKYQPRKLLGVNLLMVQGIRSAAKERRAGKSNWKGGDEAAATDEDHGRDD